MNSLLFTNLVVRDQLRGCHTPLKRVVFYLIDYRHALALWVRCNGVSDLNLVFDLATGSKGTFNFKIMRDQTTFEEIVKDFFFVHGPNAATECKLALFTLFVDHAFHVPDFGRLTNDDLNGIQAIYMLLNKLEEVERQVHHVP